LQISDSVPSKKDRLYLFLQGLNLQKSYFEKTFDVKAGKMESSAPDICTLNRGKDTKIFIGTDVS